MNSLNEIRSTFLDYFARLDHEVVASSPLVPRNDPTLLFTNSGMVQFKNIFTGLETQKYKRAVTAQKCVRAGGKHNDLDNVGYTARHHTFFEMLGNFSFGDYFKSEAIEFAWKLITNEFDIPKDRLLVTVYHSDEDAVKAWKQVAGLNDDRIIRIDTDDNFWMMGATGPCGPCTEIFFDHGEQYFGGPPGSKDEDGDRFVEIWNLVFMQFEQDASGQQNNLASQSIDTGMGIERVAALLQGTNDNYGTDLFRRLIETSADLTSTEPYGATKTHHRVIADHLRSIAFLLVDGVMPSNEGRGYVLRRIMRRSMRHALLLGATEPVIHQLVPTLTEQMGTAYPELIELQDLISETIKSEETRFQKMLERGLKLLGAEVAKLPEGVDLPGKTAFKLYDTYGFPLDLTQDALRDEDRSVDVDGFESAMAEQRRLARQAWSGSGDAAEAAHWFDLLDKHGVTEFVGYETTTAQGQVTALLQDNKQVDCIKTGEAAKLLLNQTPFYAEGGGQVGDRGLIYHENGRLSVTDTQKALGLIYHSVTVSDGSLHVGDAVTLAVDRSRRTLVSSSHSATHLLHQALRDELGNHVAQRGSLNDEGRIRFDFNHTKALTDDELRKIQADVNLMIRQNSIVETHVLAADEAQDLGALALFGEKYDHEVRMVGMGQRDGTGRGLHADKYSLELCGGTHVSRTGEIGAFVVVQDTASAAGVRRIEAYTGESALNWLHSRAEAFDWLRDKLKAQSIPDAKEKQMTLIERNRSLQNEIKNLRRNAPVAQGDSATESMTKTLNGIRFLARVLTEVAPRELPALVDQHKHRIENGAVLLLSKTNSKVAVAAGVTEDLKDRLSAVDMVRTAVAQLGGNGGGGRPDFAQGGGHDQSKINEAISAVQQFVEG
ncbi:MAG: alanine--tRNA ligase [Aestuariivita sp.]|nr:alanine--tRNA ligase [Aestuariivita sp.]MCY4201057.1 alanine--tRNA ligase [Aestuariivita sp.]MCY4288877.1 alanine--tRNA ligase [Aestuariivita sp.]MCY4345231.1 alanine--tRNA ligase [Aestuariivita sp.]